MTRKVSSTDALFVASSKGEVAGCVNVGVAMLYAQTAAPAWPTVATSMCLGFVGYGVSLVLFVFGQQRC